MRAPRLTCGLRVPSSVPGVACVGRVAFALPLVFAGLVGCSPYRSDAPPSTLDLIDFQPREADVGDHLEVIGTSLPRKRAATVVFRGRLAKPGREPIAVEIQATGESTSEGRVDIVLTDALADELCGVGDEAVHTTFHGDVELSFAAIDPGAPPLSGRVRDVVLDVQPRDASVATTSNDDGQRALAFMGVTLATSTASSAILVMKDGTRQEGRIIGDPSADPILFEGKSGERRSVPRAEVEAVQGTSSALASGGLLVAAVHEGSPAQLAGLSAGDVIVEVDGLRASTIADVVPASSISVLMVRRDNEPTLRPIAVSMRGFARRLPVALLGATLLAGLAGAAAFVAVTTGRGTTGWLSRRLQGRRGAAAPGSRRWHVLSAAAASAGLVLIPLGQRSLGATHDLAALTIVAVAAVIASPILAGGRDGGDSSSLVARARGVVQAFVGQLPGVVALACAVMSVGSLRLADVVGTQGSAPWRWLAFRTPLMAGLFALWLAPALTSAPGRASELPEAPADGARGGQLSAWLAALVTGALGAAVFLGGWQVDDDASIGARLFGAVLYLGKVWALVLGIMWARKTFPRLAGRGGITGWRALVPAALAAPFATLAGSSMQPALDRSGLGGPIAGATFAAAVAAVAWLCARVLYARRIVSTEHLDPYL